MTENAPVEGYDGWDIASVLSTILGIGAVILVLTLPYREVGFAIAAAVGAIILALAAGRVFRLRRRPISWFARIGSLAGAASLVLLFIWELNR